MEQIEAGRHVGIEEARLGERQVDLHAGQAAGQRQGQILSIAEQVLLFVRNVGDHAFGRRIAAAERDFARRLLGEIDRDDDAIRRAALLARNLDRLEQAHRLQPLFGAGDQQAVEGIAFRELELAAHDVIGGADVAEDVDPLNIHTRAILQHVVDADRAVGNVPVQFWLHDGKRIAARCQLKSYGLDGLLDLAGIERVALERGHVAHKIVAVDLGDRGRHGDVAERVVVAFFYRERQIEALAATVEVSRRRDDLRIGIAVLHVELAQQLAIEIEPVGIVDVGRLEPGQPALLGRAHDFLQLRVGKGLVADEADVLDLGTRPFADFVDDVDAVLLEFDDLRLDGGGEQTLLLVHVQDALHVGLGLGLCEHGARAELDFALQRFVLDVLVAFEDDLVDDRVLDEEHDHDRAAALYAHVAEQTCFEELGDAVVGEAGVVGLADLQRKVRPHGLGLDAAVALNLNVRNRTTGGHGRGGREHRAGERRKTHEHGQRARTRRTSPSPRNYCHPKVPLIPDHRSPPVLLPVIRVKQTSSTRPVSSASVAANSARLLVLHQRPTPGASQPHVVPYHLTDIRRSD